VHRLRFLLQVLLLLLEQVVVLLLLLEQDLAILYQLLLVLLVLLLVLLLVFYFVDHQYVLAYLQDGSNCSNVLHRMLHRLHLLQTFL
jgi:hypothetical protein